ncbi:MAG: hypothetical protein ACFFD4_08150 [Candidatus Odinarchaeota archaeon]
MKIKLIAWITALVLSLGFTEAANYYHHLNGLGWNTYWLYFLAAIITAIIVVSIIPLTTGRKTDVILSFSLLFFIQLLEDIAFHLSNFAITGKLELWKPICQILRVSFPIPLFWIIDIVAGSSLMICYVIKTDVQFPEEKIIGVETV